MTVQDIISVISAYDTIHVQDEANQRVYNGWNGNFKATCDWAYDVLDNKVSRVMSNASVTIIFC